MQLTYLEMTDLDIEDFRRLGVRLHESRSLVIRRAAARSSKSLAESQLLSPTADNALQLSRIVTSTYRLLDPRKRPDFLQRAQVGRLFQVAVSQHDPNQYGISAFKALSRQNEAWQSETGEGVELLTAARDVASDFADSPEISDLEAEPAFTLSQHNRDSFISLVRSLDAQDLIRRRPYRPPINSVRRTIEHPWMIVSLIAVLVLTMIGLAKLDFSPQPLSMQRIDSSEAATTGEVEAEVKKRPSQPMPPPAVSVPPQQPQPPKATDTTVPESSEQAGIELPKLPSVSIETSDPPVPPAIPPASEGLTESSTELDEQQVEMTNKTAEESSEFAPDPFAAMQDRGADLPLSDPDVSIVKPENEQPSPTTSLAIEPVLLSESITPADVTKLDSKEIAARISSFSAEKNRLILKPDRRELYKTGMLLADDLLRFEAFDSCKQLLREIQFVAETLEPSDVAEVATFERDLEQSKRIAEKVQSINLQSIEQASDADIGVAGRYYCLMLRRWDVGLDWLSKTSDPTLAAIAKQEVELKETDRDHGSQAWIALANRWESAAKRADGRAKHSLLFHVVNLKQQAIDLLAGVAQLEQQREVDWIESQLPVYLQMALQRDREPVIMEPLEMGMLGRVTIDGQKTPIQLIYSLGTTLNADALQKIEKVWTVKERRLQIELSGNFVLFETTTLRFSVSPNSGREPSRLFLDGKRLEFIDGRNVAERTLDAGGYRIDWRLQLTPESNEYLQIEDATSAAKIELRHEKPPPKVPSL